MTPEFGRAEATTAEEGRLPRTRRQRAVWRRARDKIRVHAETPSQRFAPVTRLDEART